MWINSFDFQQKVLRSILGSAWSGEVPNTTNSWPPYMDSQHFQDVMQLKALWQVSVLPILCKRDGPSWVAREELWDKYVSEQAMKHVPAFAVQALASVLFHDHYQHLCKWASWLHLTHGFGKWEKHPRTVSDMCSSWKAGEKRKGVRSRQGLSALVSSKGKSITSPTSGFAVFLVWALVVTSPNAALAGGLGENVGRVSSPSIHGVW